MCLQKKVYHIFDFQVCKLNLRSLKFLRLLFSLKNQLIFKGVRANLLRDRGLQKKSAFSILSDDLRKCGH
jgi:hypothetical protein